MEAREVPLRAHPEFSLGKPMLHQPTTQPPSLPPPAPRVVRGSRGYQGASSQRSLLLSSSALWMGSLQKAEL